MRVETKPRNVPQNAIQPIPIRVHSRDSREACSLSERLQPDVAVLDFHRRTDVHLHADLPFERPMRRVVVDDDADHRAAEGKLGVQVHVGPPMKVEYRDIRLKQTKE